MAHLGHNVGVNVEVDNGKSHVDRPLKVAWKGTGISPLLEKLIVAINPFLDLSEVGSPPHLSKKIPLVELEGFAFLKIGAGLDSPDPKTEFMESVTISIGDREGNFFCHKNSLSRYVKTFHFVNLTDSGFSIPVGSFQKVDAFSLGYRKDLQKAMINLPSLHFHPLGSVSLNFFLPLV
jgi:hypothetical protein